MRRAFVLMFLAGCGNSADVQGPGSGDCEYQGGAAWYFQTMDVVPLRTSVEVELNTLIAGNTGLYVSGLKYANAAEQDLEPITSNLRPNSSADVSLQGYFTGTLPFSMMPNMPAVCQWDAIGPLS